MIFSIFFVGIVTIISLFVFSTIGIELEKLEISNINRKKIEYNYDAYINLYIFDFIRLAKVKINKKNVNKRRFIKNIDFFEISKEIRNFNEKKGNIKYKVEKLNLILKVGTEDISITSILVFLSSILISYILTNTIEKYDKQKQKYKINAIYSNKNLIDLKLNCIIKVKMVHIINVIYIVWKKRGGRKNERSSNRRFNDDCDEQYTGHGRCEHNYR